MINGIYTLANDEVYHQLVALLNSIEVNHGKHTPVCVIAYDNRVEKVKADIAKRENVTLLNDPAIFSPWEDFSLQVWKTHPSALETWREKKGINGVYRIGMNRRYCAFDPNSPFDKFIYLDADTLVLGSLDYIFELLDQQEFVTYDFQFKDLTHIFNVNYPKLLEVFDNQRLTTEIFCAGFYAGRKGLFSQETRDWLVSQLQSGDAEVLYMSAPNQSVLNYMVMKSGVKNYNLALNLPEGKATGCSVTSPHFENINNVLYDRGNRLTYLHYIGVSSKLFNQLCEGTNFACPYRDLFLHYRYLHEPENQPKFTSKPKQFDPPPSLTKRVLRKLGLTR